MDEAEVHRLESTGDKFTNSELEASNLNASFANLLTIQHF